MSAGSRTTPHEDNSPPDKNKAQPLPTRTTIPRTLPHQDNSPLGPLPRNKTTHQDQNLYGGELSGYDVSLLPHVSAKPNVVKPALASKTHSFPPLPPPLQGGSRIFKLGGGAQNIMCPHAHSELRSELTFCGGPGPA